MPTLKQRTNSSKRLLTLLQSEIAKKIAQFLLQHNADIVARNVPNFTSLIIAAQYGQAEVTQLLIQHNADIEAKG